MDCGYYDAPAKNFKPFLAEIRYDKPKTGQFVKRLRRSWTGNLHDGELLGLLLRRVAGNLGNNHENPSIHLKGQISTNDKMFVF